MASIAELTTPLAAITTSTAPPKYSLALDSRAVLSSPTSISRRIWRRLVSTSGAISFVCASDTGASRPFCKTEDNIFSYAPTRAFSFPFTLS